MKHIPFIFLVSLFYLLPNFAYSQNLASKIDSLYQVQNETLGFSIAKQLTAAARLMHEEERKLPIQVMEVGFEKFKVKKKN